MFDLYQKCSHIFHQSSSLNASSFHALVRFPRDLNENPLHSSTPFSKLNKNALQLVPFKSLTLIFNKYVISQLLLSLACQTESCIKTAHGVS